MCSHRRRVGKCLYRISGTSSLRSGLSVANWRILATDAGWTPHRWEVVTNLMTRSTVVSEDVSSYSHALHQNTQHPLPAGLKSITMLTNHLYFTWIKLYFCMRNYFLMLQFYSTFSLPIISFCKLFHTYFPIQWRVLQFINALLTITSSDLCTITILSGVELAKRHRQ